MFINQYYNFWFDEFTVLVIATVSPHEMFDTYSPFPDICLYFIANLLCENLSTILHSSKNLLLQNPTTQQQYVQCFVQVRFATLRKQQAQINCSFKLFAEIVMLVFADFYAGIAIIKEKQKLVYLFQ